MENNEIEKVETYYIDETKLKKQPYTVYRIKIKGGRIYFTIDPDGTVTRYISLTTLTKHTLPTSEALIKWQCSLGYEAAKAYMNERANYGSCFHVALGEFLTKGEWNFNNAETWIQMQVAKGVIKECNVEKYADELNKDVAAFAQFCVEYKVKPIAIELILVSKDGYATLLDLVCKMTVKVDGLDHANPYKSGERKGLPREVKVEKEITGLINFKSSKSGSFYEDQEIQLAFEQRLFEENYPEIKIDEVYNWSPKDYRGNTPTYNLKNQSDSLDAQKADALLTIAKIELFKRTPRETFLEGKVKLGELPEVKETDFEAYIKERAMATQIF